MYKGRQKNMPPRIQMRGQKAAEMLSNGGRMDVDKWPAESIAVPVLNAKAY